MKNNLINTFQPTYYPVNNIPFQPYTQIINNNRNQWDIQNVSTTQQYRTTSYQSPYPVPQTLMGMNEY